MGRAEIALLFFLFFIATPALALDFDCDKKFDDYYFGGEYLYFTCTVTADAESYLIQSSLDHSAIVVVVQYDDGKRAIHPLPDDHYQSDKNGTSLQFSESRDVDRLEITVSGYVPVIEERLDNVSAIKVEADGDKILNAEIRVVNKQKFYSDLRDFEGEDCVDDKKLREAKTLYNEKKYLEAESILKEVEEGISKCIYEEEKERLTQQLDGLKERLTEISTSLAFIQYRLEYDRDKIENYDQVLMEWQNLTANKEEIDSLIDDTVELISRADFDGAKANMEKIDGELTNLKAKVEALKASIEERKELLSFDPITLAAVIGGVAVVIVAALAIASSRRKDKW